MEHELAFDLSSPKVLIGLLIGGFLPYLLPTIPAAVTKCLLFRSVIRKFRRPGCLRLCCVAISEPFCSLLAVGLAESMLRWPRIDALAAACAFYSVLGMFANLLLFPSGHRPSRTSLAKRAPYAFGMGLIYLAYVFPVAYGLWSLVRPS